MNTTIMNLIILITAIIIHEAGHYATFRAYKIKPDIKLTWWGIQMGEKIKDKMKEVMKNDKS